MAQNLFLLVLAAYAGISLVIQQALNSNLRVALDSAAWPGFISYLAGLICMAILAVALRDPLPASAVAGRIPWWAWCGGVFGAIFIALGIYLVPLIGAATFFAVLIAGQMIGSIVFDHFGWLGLAQKPVDLTRLAGAALLIAGVVLIRR